MKHFVSMRQGDLLCVTSQYYLTEVSYKQIIHYDNNNINNNNTLYMDTCRLETNNFELNFRMFVSIKYNVIELV